MAITTVYIVGGTAAVSTNVSNAIAAMHVSNNNANAFINVIRVAGADRYATNNQVDLFNGASAVNTAIVAVGSNFADALAVAPVVVTKKFPLVLTNGPSLSASAQSTLVNLGIKNVIIVGGTSAVSAATEASIKALGITIAYRIAGADRTQTAADDRDLRDHGYRHGSLRGDHLVLRAQRSRSQHRPGLHRPWRWIR